MRCTLSPGGRGCRAAEGREAGEGFFVRSITPHPARNSLRSFLATLSRKGGGYESAAPAFAVAQVLPIQHDGQTKTRRLFCPTSPVLPAKIFLFPKIRNCGLTSASRAHQEGRLAIVTNRWCGMRWTRSRRKTCGAARTVKPCGPVPSTLGSTPGSRAQGDGG